MNHTLNPNNFAKLLLSAFLLGSFFTPQKASAISVQEIKNDLITAFITNHKTLLATTFAACSMWFMYQWLLVYTQPADLTLENNNNLVDDLKLAATLFVSGKFNKFNHQMNEIVRKYIRGRKRKLVDTEVTTHSFNEDGNEVEKMVKDKEKRHGSFGLIGKMDEYFEAAETIAKRLKAIADLAPSTAIIYLLYKNLNPNYIAEQLSNIK